jgi:hypothetical protein
MWAKRLSHTGIHIVQKLETKSKDKTHLGFTLVFAPEATDQH